MTYIPHKGFYLGDVELKLDKRAFLNRLWYETALMMVSNSIVFCVNKQQKQVGSICGWRCAIFYLHSGDRL